MKLDLDILVLIFTFYISNFLVCSFLLFHINYCLFLFFFLLLFLMSTVITWIYYNTGPILWKLLVSVDSETLWQLNFKILTCFLWEYNLCIKWSVHEINCNCGGLALLGFDLEVADMLFLYKENMLLASVVWSWHFIVSFFNLL